MKLSAATLVVALCVSASVGQAQTQAPAQPAPTDIYNVMFVKAAPGQAAALAKQLQQSDPKDPMASHYLLLRHQEGADWDYCVIRHVGTKASVEITAPPPNVDAPTRAWHEDTFVAGPPWAEFERLMGLTGDQSATAVYVVGVHRPAPGHRQQLAQALRRPSPNAKVASNSVMMAHVEGGPWQFLTIDRYGSWQDFGADRAASATGEGWLEVRQHSAFHSDTIADRVR